MSRRTAQSSEVRVTYTPRPDATSETELSALTVVYRFILDCRERKKAAPASRPDDAEGEPNGIRATPILPK
jgi:hypothetical protein